eukprot:m51a1_g6642 hypothetical protein (449) ;mRNA; f:110758-112257
MARLVPVGTGGQPIALAPGENIVGRSDATSIRDPKCSRRQVSITLDPSGRAFLTTLGMNSSVVSRTGGRDEVVTKGAAPVELRDGDVVQLLIGQYAYALSLNPDATQAADSQPTPAQQPMSQPSPPPANVPPASGGTPARPPQSAEATPDRQQQRDEGAGGAADDGDARPVCKYGATCYRKNADHLAQYRHPQQPQSPSRAQQQQQQPQAPQSQSQSQPQQQQQQPSGDAQTAQTAPPPQDLVADDRAPRAAQRPVFRTPVSAPAAASRLPAGPAQGSRKLVVQALGTSVLRFAPRDAAAVMGRVAGEFLERHAAPDLRLAVADEDQSILEEDARFEVLCTHPSALWAEGYAVACEVNWRWKQADPRMHDVLGADFAALVTARHPRPGQAGNVYDVQVEGRPAVFLCVPPNVGNPDKPDYLTGPESLETGRALYEQMVRRLLQQAFNQ